MIDTFSDRVFEDDHTTSEVSSVEDINKEFVCMTLLTFWDFDGGCGGGDSEFFTETAVTDPTLSFDSARME